ncbi:hypothetical protein [Actinoallomurus sp. NPDC052274]|uniref:hypothetical protein n=1 Tax=Actinoallomurus sp. NPDC052274 TaxID=3155420 RepID=UPI00343695F0
MPTNGRTTVVLNAKTYKVQAVLDTGPRTNHPNFVTVGGVDYAYVTVGDLNQTLVYRRSPNGGPHRHQEHVGGQDSAHRAVPDGVGLCGPRDSRFPCGPEPTGTEHARRQPSD